MSEVKTIRINKVLRELNISLDRAVEQLGEHGFEIEARPTSKISQAEYQLLVDDRLEFCSQSDKLHQKGCLVVGEQFLDLICEIKLNEY